MYLCLGKVTFLRDIDISGGYKEWINVIFIFKDKRIKEKVYVVDFIGNFRFKVVEKFFFYDL